MLTSRLKQTVPLGLRKDVKVARARFTQRLGIERYTFPALADLDRKMLDRLPERGVFLEVGANDGYSQSNTYHLEAVRKWRGILIEPLPSLYARCKRVRKGSYCYNAACVADPSTTVVELVDLDLMSVTLGQQDRTVEERRVGKAGNRVAVRARTISSIIDESPFEHVDFMSVDVEGAELSLLRGLELPRHAPTWLLVETARVDDVAEILSPHLTLQDQLSRHDYLFARSPSADD